MGKTTSDWHMWCEQKSHRTRVWPSAWHTTRTRLQAKDADRRWSHAFRSLTLGDPLWSGIDLTPPSDGNGKLLWAPMEGALEKIQPPTAGSGDRKVSGCRPHSTSPGDNSFLLPLFHYHSPFSSTTNLSFKHTWLNSTSLLGRARYEFLIVILSLVIPYYICLAQQAFDKYVQNNWKVEHLQRNLQNMYWNYNMSSFSDMSYRLEGCVLTEEEAGVRWLAQGQEGQPQVRHTPSHNHPRESRGSNIQILTHLCQTITWAQQETPTLAMGSDT